MDQLRNLCTFTLKWPATLKKRLMYAEEWKRVCWTIESTRNREGRCLGGGRALAGPMPGPAQLLREEGRATRDNEQ